MLSKDFISEDTIYFFKLFMPRLSYYSVYNLALNNSHLLRFKNLFSEIDNYDIPYDVLLLKKDDTKDYNNFVAESNDYVIKLLNKYNIIDNKQKIIINIGERFVMPLGYSMCYFGGDDDLYFSFVHKSIIENAIFNPYLIKKVDEFKLMPKFVNGRKSQILIGFEDLLMEGKFVKDIKELDPDYISPERLEVERLRKQREEQRIKNLEIVELNNFLAQFQKHN
jgi:hypothetical protein